MASKINVVVSGPAGCGKTRLIAKLAVFLKEEGFKNVQILMPEYEHVVTKSLLDGIKENDHLRLAREHSIIQLIEVHTASHRRSCMDDSIALESHQREPLVVTKG